MSGKQRTAEERLRWFLLDTQPTMIGDYEIWERLEQDETIDISDMTDDDYLRHCFIAIDAAIAAQRGGEK